MNRRSNAPPSLLGIGKLILASIIIGITAWAPSTVVLADSGTLDCYGSNSLIAKTHMDTDELVTNTSVIGEVMVAGGAEIHDEALTYETSMNFSTTSMDAVLAGWVSTDNVESLDWWNGFEVNWQMDGLEVASQMRLPAIWPNMAFYGFELNGADETATTYVYDQNDLNEILATSAIWTPNIGILQGALTGETMVATAGGGFVAMTQASPRLGV